MTLLTSAGHKYIQPLRLLFSLKPKEMEMAKMRLLAICIGQRQSFKIAKKYIVISYTQNEILKQKILPEVGLRGRQNF